MKTIPSILFLFLITLKATAEFSMPDYRYKLNDKQEVMSVTITHIIDTNVVCSVPDELYKATSLSSNINLIMNGDSVEVVTKILDASFLGGIDYEIKKFFLTSTGNKIDFVIISASTYGTWPTIGFIIILAITCGLLFLVYKEGTGPKVFSYLGTVAMVILIAFIFFSSQESHHIFYFLNIVNTFVMLAIILFAYIIYRAYKSGKFTVTGVLLKTDL